MTAVTTRPNRAGLSLGIVAAAAVLVFLAFAGQDDGTLGRPGDPNGTGPEGLAALRELIEQTAGQAEIEVSVPSSGHDVAILATNAYTDVFAVFEDRPDETDANLAPVLDWVKDGGVLVTAVVVPGGPIDGAEFVDEDEAVSRGTCDFAAVSGVAQLRPLEHVVVEVGEFDQSCFGDGDTALLVVRDIGAGQVIRLAGMGMFANRALDDFDNAALAARVLQLQEGRSVAFLSGPAAQPLGGDGGPRPVNDEGTPVGAGDSSLLDLVPKRVLALFVGLALAFGLYAFAKARRLGSPVTETTPIKLPSSSFVEAVGRMYARAENPQARSAEILRNDFRTAMARRIGMAPTSSGTEIAALLETTAEERTTLGTLLDGPPPATDEGLTSLAADLNNRRLRMERGGAVDLMSRSTRVPTEGNPE